MDDEPVFRISERFTPVYFMHHRVLQAVIKYLGGMEFRYPLKGDRQKPTLILTAEDQRNSEPGTNGTYS